MLLLLLLLLLLFCRHSLIGLFFTFLAPLKRILTPYIRSPGFTFVPVTPRKPPHPRPCSAQCRDSVACDEPCCSWVLLVVSLIIRYYQ